jgi:integrase
MILKRRLDRTDRSGPQDRALIGWWAKEQTIIAASGMLIFTGARLGEILTAKWSQFDRDRGVLFLDDSKTGRKTIYLSGAAKEVLAALGSFSVA